MGVANDQVGEADATELWEDSPRFLRALRALTGFPHMTSSIPEQRERESWVSREDRSDHE